MGHHLRRPGTRALASLLATGVLAWAGAVPAAAAPGDPSPENPGFEAGDLRGWSVVRGTAFSDASVTDATDWGWGGPFAQEGARHLWGFRPGGDGPTGELRSSTFTLTGSGSVSLLVGGGYDPERLHVSLVRAADGRELFRTTGLEDEAYRCTQWDGARHVGEQLYVRVVDEATGGFGHLNLDGVDTTDGTCATTPGLTPISLPSALPAPGSVGLQEWYGADPYRPQFHFSPLRNWMNDPNGLIQWRGQYHLFYQHNPARPVWGPMHWGHAVSDDLVHWTHRPIALAPPAPAAEGDLSGIFSGSAVDHDGVLSLVYTEFADPVARPGAVPETIGLATSPDGRTFTKHPGPVVGGPPASASAGWRDPKVWKDDDGLFKMVVGAGDARTGRGNVQLYSSPDLRTWTSRGVLFEGDGTNGRMWECPDLFPIGRGKWALLVSVNDSGIQRVLSFVGRREGDRFVAERAGEHDLGLDAYATQTFLDARGRRIAISWMNRWGGSMPERLNGWGGAMTAPRELFLGADGQLASRPVPELRQLRDAGTLLRTTVADGAEQVLGVRGDALELEAEFDLRATSARSFGIDVRRSPDGSERTRIAFDRETRRLTIDRGRSGVGDSTVVGGRIAGGSGERLSLRILLDRSSVEVFTGEGSSVTARIHPRFRESVGVALFASGGSARVDRLRSFRLRSSWRGAWPAGTAR